MAERDRDESGRPRSTRPRDALGRPLPQGSLGVPRIPDDLELPPAETVAYAQDLLDRGLAFNAHEVLEAAWKNGPDSEKTLWQALAQLAVGVTHVQRGNVEGAIDRKPISPASTNECSSSCVCRCAAVIVPTANGCSTIATKPAVVRLPSLKTAPNAAICTLSPSPG